MNFEKDKAGLPWYKRFIAGNLLLNFLTVPDFIAYKFEDRKGYCLRACVRTWGAQEVSWTIRKKRTCSPARQTAASPSSNASTRTNRKNRPPQLLWRPVLTDFSVQPVWP